MLPQGEQQVRLKLREGRELIRRLENGAAEQPEIVKRILRARQAPYPQRFALEPGDGAVLLAALQQPPDLDRGRLAELQAALQNAAG